MVQDNGGPKVVAIAYDRSLTRGSEYSDLTGKKWYVGKEVSHIERIDCIRKHKQRIL